MQRAAVVIPSDLDVNVIGQLLGYCARRSYTLAGVAVTLIGALQMLNAGQADVIVVHSRRVFPGLEIISQEVAWPVLPRVRQRPRRLPRGR